MKESKTALSGLSTQSFFMDTAERDQLLPEKRPACFGDEAKLVNYLETSDAESECARCPSEDDCGEFILLKCSRELIF